MWWLVLRSSSQILNYVKSSSSLWVFKNCQPKLQESLNWTPEWMQRFFIIFFAYYDSPLTIGLDEIIKRLQMFFFNNPQCGHKEAQNFPIFLLYNHQGESSHISKMCLDISSPRHIKHFDFKSSLKLTNIGKDVILGEISAMYNML